MSLSDQIFVYFMSDSTLPEPKQVVYHPVTGVPEEFHEYLHKDSDEYKRLKQSREASTCDVSEKAADLSLVRFIASPGQNRMKTQGAGGSFVLSASNT